MKKHTSIRFDNGNVMNIKTDGKSREILTYWDLPEKWQKEFDYIDPEDGASFFKYRNNYYDLGNFIALGKGDPLAKEGWDGAMGESYFSGMLIKISEDSENVIVGKYWQ